MDRESELLTPIEAAQMLKVSPGTVRRLLRQGHLRAVRPSPSQKAVRLLADDLHAFLAARTAPIVTP